MSHARKLRRAHRWARYFNHYAHIPDVVIGGLAPVRYMHLSGSAWASIRRQQRCPFADGYPMVGIR